MKDVIYLIKDGVSEAFGYGEFIDEEKVFKIDFGYVNSNPYIINELKKSAIQGVIIDTEIYLKTGESLFYSFMVASLESNQNNEWAAVLEYAYTFKD